MRRATFGFLFILWIGGMGCSKLRPNNTNVKTTSFLDGLSIAKYEQNGADFLSLKYSPFRLGIPLKDIDRTYGYDFQRLALVTEKLEGVDRRTVLTDIFGRLARGQNSQTDKHIAVLKFLQQTAYNSFYFQPMYEDRRMVTDPLVLLELGEMRCGHVARVACDIFAAAGYETRLVQLGGHVISEIFYEEDWHYFDADVFGNGETIRDDSGNIPSIVELAKNPFAIDSLGHYRELKFGGQSRKGSLGYPSWNYFAAEAYSPGTTLYYVKTADEHQEKTRFYGWNHYTKESDKNRELFNGMKRFYQPGAITFKKIRLIVNGQMSVYIEWVASNDTDNDLSGYTIYLSKKSRGWNYNKFSGPQELMKYWNNSLGWQPHMYDRLYREPPFEVDKITTENTSIVIPFKQAGTYFLTIMPYDKHGMSVGKRLYQMSEELKIEFL